MAPAGYQGRISWAKVETDSTISSQSGGISLEGNPFEGGYYLHFPQSVANKAILATPTYDSVNPGANTSVTEDVVADDADEVDDGVGDDSGGVHDLVAGGVQGGGEAGSVGVEAGLAVGGVDHGGAQDLVGDQ